MKFRSHNLRTLPEDFSGNLRNHRHLTLLLLKASGSVAFANTVGEKEALIADYDAAKDFLMLAWTGQWRTDIFQVRPQDLEKYWPGWDAMADRVAGRVSPPR